MRHLIALPYASPPRGPPEGREIGHSVDIVSEIFEVVGDPYVTLEAVAILLVLWWTGRFSHLVLVLSLCATLSIEAGAGTTLGVPDFSAFLR